MLDGQMPWKAPISRVGVWLITTRNMKKSRNSIGMDFLVSRDSAICSLGHSIWSLLPWLARGPSHMPFSKSVIISLMKSKIMKLSSFAREYDILKEWPREMHSWRKSWLMRKSSKSKACRHISTKKRIRTCLQDRKTWKIWRISKVQPSTQTKSDEDSSILTSIL